METEHLEIIQIVAGPIDTNAFIVTEKASKQTLIVDAPPGCLQPIESAVAAGKLEPILLVLTHGHWDHIGDAEALKLKFDIPIVAHVEDVPMLENPGHEGINGFCPDRVVPEGHTIRLGEITFEVMHTPGHSPGQISLISRAEDVMFGGDTLFPNGFGTLEVAGASPDQTVQTLGRLTSLSDSIVVYPGHGARTTIGAERHWMVGITDANQLG